MLKSSERIQNFIKISPLLLLGVQINLVEDEKWVLCKDKSKDTELIYIPNI